MAVGMPTFLDLPQTTAFFPNVSIPTMSQVKCI